MKKITLSFLLLLSLVDVTFCQNSEVKSIQPILLDKSILSGVGLEKIEIKAEPEKDFYQKNLYKGEELSVYIVSTETWVNKMDNFPFDEFIYMFHGQAKILPSIGQTKIFNAGDYFFAPKGYIGDWEIKAGSNLHYELSVISTSREDDSKIKPEQSHFLIDKAILSGTHINFEDSDSFTEVLISGAELTISLSAEIPGTKIVDIPIKERLIQVLTGQLSLTDEEGNIQKFYTGDFVIIPKNFTGKWESAGHGIFKYLLIERSF